MSSAPWFYPILVFTVVGVMSTLVVQLLRKPDRDVRLKVYLPIVGCFGIIFIVTVIVDMMMR